MPKTLARSVIAKAGIPSAAARATASSMRTIPSVMENSLWSRRWTKAGFGIGLRGTGEAKILPPAPAPHDANLTAFKKLRHASRSNERVRPPRGIHDPDQRTSRARPGARPGFRRGGNRIQVPAPRRHDGLFRRSLARSEADRPLPAGPGSAAKNRARKARARRRRRPQRNRPPARSGSGRGRRGDQGGRPIPERSSRAPAGGRSEEHTSELQSQFHLVCRLLLEKKKKKQLHKYTITKKKKKKIKYII